MNTNKNVSGVHVVIGSGPIGRAVAAGLAGGGASTVLASRSAEQTPIPGVVTRNVDATNADQLRAVVQSAAVVYNCANAPYHQWPQKLPPIWDGILAAAVESGARLVIASNLYAYGAPSAPLDGSEPFAPCSRKGRVRATLESAALEAHERGELPVAIVRASDFYGPGVAESALGARFLNALLSGKSPMLFGSGDHPHSYTYVPDFADALVAVGTADDESVYGRSWIAPTAPPVTRSELQSALRTLGHPCSIGMMGVGMTRFAGLFVPAAREMVEMMYEFDRPFTVDSSETETRFALPPTPVPVGLEQTLRAFEAERNEKKG